MKINLSPYDSVLFLLLVLPVVTGCHKVGTCHEEEAAAKVVSLIAPEEIKRGETVVITLGALNKDSLCITGLKGQIVQQKDTLHIQAALRYTGVNGTTGCDCLRDSILYTQVYFYPTVTGSFWIIYGDVGGWLTTSGSNGRHNIKVIE